MQGEEYNNEDDDVADESMENYEPLPPPFRPRTQEDIDLDRRLDLIGFAVVIKQEPVDEQALPQQEEQQQEGLEEEEEVPLERIKRRRITTTNINNDNSSSSSSTVRIKKEPSSSNHQD